MLVIRRTLLYVVQYKVLQFLVYNNWIVSSSGMQLRNQVCGREGRVELGYRDALAFKIF